MSLLHSLNIYDISVTFCVFIGLIDVRFLHLENSPLILVTFCVSLRSTAVTFELEYRFFRFVTLEGVLNGGILLDFRLLKIELPPDPPIVFKRE